jgi:diacylglycerol O-acyltransferase
MERLTGQDAAFLYNETPDQHMHTLKVAVIDPSTMPGEYSFALVREILAARLDLVPPFRRRVVEVPGRLHHPLWVEDPDFDIDRHLHRIAAPAPGGRDELDALVSDIAGIPLDRRRPLWEIYVVEGLEDGRIGFVTKLHHSAADGVMAATMLNRVLSDDQAASTEPPPATPWTPERVPSMGRLLLDALVELLRTLARVPALLVSTARGLWAVLRERRRGALATTPPFSGPTLSFNCSLTPARRFVTATLPLSVVKSAKVALDVTVNDVVLTVCTGALRAYLDERGELPDRALVAAVPVSTWSPGSPPRANSVSNLFAPLPVQLADPVEQAQAIHAATRDAKRQVDLLGREMLAGWSDVTPPAPYAAAIRLYGRLGLADHHRPPVNLVVSSVPGPRTPLYIAGARLDAIYSMGPILEGVGLNITVWSYVDDLEFGIVAERDSLPDLARLRDHLADALTGVAAAARTT